MNKLKRAVTFKYFMIRKISKANCCRVCYYNDMETVPVPLETEVILQDNKRKNSFVHSEDLVLKSAAAYFGDELIHWLGIKEKALRPAPTELVEIEARHMYEDFLYEMENGTYYHFEFESDSISEEDLKRFREYEASTARLYGAPVITHVICSSKAKKLRGSITEGINTYRVRLIQLKEYNADKVLTKLIAKTEGAVTRENIIPLLFAPLMGGHSEQKDRILHCIQILKNAESAFQKNEIQKMEAILYVLASKFLDNEELELIKEAITMTKLGQMIWDDAIEVGEKRASERYSRLILILSQENKDDLIVKIASDPEYRETLYKKYGI